MNIDKPASPLDDLLEDESQATTQSETILAELLKPYAYIGKNTKGVVLRDAANKLPVKLRVLLIFLGKLAAMRLGHITDESLSQKEAIVFLTEYGIPVGTVKVSLKQLRDDKLIVSKSSSRYSTGFDKLTRIKKEFERYDTKQG